MVRKAQKLLHENVMQSWDILLVGQGAKQADFYTKFQEELL